MNDTEMTTGYKGMNYSVYEIAGMLQDNNDEINKLTEQIKLYKDLLSLSEIAKRKLQKELKELKK